MQTNFARMSIVAIVLSIVGCDTLSEDELADESDFGTRAVKIVQRAAKKGRAKQSIDAELVEVNRLVELAPDNMKVVGAAAYLSFAEGMRLAESKDLENSSPHLETALKHMQRVEESNETSAQIEELRDEVYLNAARVISMKGDAERAMEILDRAAKSGFVDPDLLTIDVAFSGLKDRQDFKDLVARLTQQLIDFEFDFSLQDADGNTFALSDYSGQVVVANFWGTWCPPCRMEIPDFIELQRELRDDGLQFVGLTYENGKPRAQVNELIKNFKQQNQMNYPLLVGEQSVIDQVPHIRSFPTTLIIDRGGKVRKRISGAVTKSQLHEILVPFLEESRAVSAGGDSTKSND